jgi:hypothetical protein
MKILVEKKLVKFALDYIWTQKAIKEKVYHDQPTQIEDMQALIDDGKMPLGWYQLKKEFDLDNTWKEKPIEAGWYWMRDPLSSKAPCIRKVDWFFPYFVIEGSPLYDWKYWEFNGPIPEPQTTESQNYE